MDLTGFFLAVFDAIYGILEWLNTWWVSPATEILLAACFAYLTCVSPQVDWSFIKEGPARFFTLAFVVLSYIRLGPYLVNPKLHFSCDPQSATVAVLANPGLARHCKLEWRGEYDSYGLFDFVIDGFLNSLSALAVLASGFVIGLTVRKSLPFDRELHRLSGPDGLPMSAGEKTGPRGSRTKSTPNPPTVGGTDAAQT